MLERLDTLRRPWTDLPQRTKEAILARIRENRYGPIIYKGQHRDLEEQSDERTD